MAAASADTTYELAFFHLLSHSAFLQNCSIPFPHSPTTNIYAHTEPPRRFHKNSKYRLKSDVPHRLCWLQVKDYPGLLRVVSWVFNGLELVVKRAR